MSRVAIKNILPNPHRHIDRYPISPEKVAALRESIRVTTYWDNLVGRPKSNGKQIEIAYGHHRLEALKEEFGHNREVEVILRPLDEEQMLQIMARENMEEFGTSAVVEQETVRAVVEAAAEGKIALEPPAKRTRKQNLRFAPLFVPGNEPPDGPAVPYTPSSIGSFLGWTRPDGEPQRKVSSTLRALQLIEEGLLDEPQFNGLTSTQARAVVDGTWKIRKRKREAARAALQEAEDTALAAKRQEEKLERERQELVGRAARAEDPAQRKALEEETRQKERERRDAEIEAEIRRKELEEEKRRTAARQREADRKAKKAAGEMADGMSQGSMSIKEAEKKAEGIAPAPVAPSRIRKSSARLAADLAGLLTPEGDARRHATLTSAVRHKTELPEEVKRDLIQALEGLAGRARQYAGALGGN